MADLYKLIDAVTEDVPHLISNLANISAVIYDELTDLNWAGFYIMQDGRLVLGPFQGKVACIEIQVGKGVCGTAVERDSTMLVKDVHEFAGHIACDSASESEIVVPLHKDGRIWGVLDIDSPTKARFTEEDKVKIERAAKSIEEVIARC